MSSTDTKQASELYELCKKVYELTGWKPSKQYESWYRKGHYFSDGVEMQPGEPFLEEHSGQFSDFPYKYVAPLYTSDYLLEKLPKVYVNEYKELFQLNLYADRSEELWFAGYDDSGIDTEADTPLKALLKLTTALSEAGELNG